MKKLRLLLIFLNYINIKTEYKIRDEVISLFLLTYFSLPKKEFFLVFLREL